MIHNDVMYYGINVPCFTASAIQHMYHILVMLVRRIRSVKWQVLCCIPKT